MKQTILGAIALILGIIILGYGIYTIYPKALICYIGYVLIISGRAAAISSRP